MNKLNLIHADVSNISEVWRSPPPDPLLLSGASFAPPPQPSAHKGAKCVLQMEVVVLFLVASQRAWRQTAPINT